MMRDDFCAFILTHGRPDRVHTYQTLQKSGYTGKVFIVIDDEDKAESQYRQKFGDQVLKFDKRAIAARIDEGDNFQDRRAIIYARNACWELARQVGCRYFIHLDYDYTSFQFRYTSKGQYGYVPIHTTLDDVLTAMLEFFMQTPMLTLALSQGGDHIGGSYLGGVASLGSHRDPRLKRKAMNSFICSVDREFEFIGRVNEDVNTYVTLGRQGHLFCTVMQAQLFQKQTQTNAGGMTELYLDCGTYLKTFYSVMYAPSCVKVGVLGDPRSPHYRMHHDIDWDSAAPAILDERWKKR